jgi:hypothetical protein
VPPKVRFSIDSPLEEAVTSELVSHSTGAERPFLTACLAVIRLRFFARIALPRKITRRKMAETLGFGGCAYRLCHPNVVPMETAEPSD